MIGLLLSLATAASAEPSEVSAARRIPAEETVELPCGYEVGQTHTYTLDARTVREQGEERQTHRLRAKVTLTVAAHDDRKTALDVRYSEPVLEGPVELGERLVLAVAEEGYRIEVDHETGKPQVADTDAVMAVYQRVADEVIAALEADPPPMVEEAKAWVKAFTSDRNMAAQRALNDLQPLVAFTCGPVPAGESRYDTVLTSPLGTGELPAEGRLTGKLADGLYTVEVQEALDPDKALQVLRPTLAGLGAPLPPDATAEDLQLEMSTTLRVEVDRTTGWPRRWTRERRGTVMGRGRVDTTVMSRVD